MAQRSMESVNGPMLEEQPEDGAPSPDDAINMGMLPNLLSYHLRLAYEASLQAYAQRTVNLGLRPGSFGLLHLIKLNPGITQTALSRASARDKSTLTPALRHLEENGLIRREQILEDRRSYRLFVTPDGEVAADELAREAVDLNRELDQIVGAHRRDDLVAALHRITTELRIGEAGRKEKPGS
jgi:DNA-binding MarR family transcriptional regulator